MDFFVHAAPTNKLALCKGITFITSHSLTHLTRSIESLGTCGKWVLFVYHLQIDRLKEAKATN